MSEHKISKTFGLMLVVAKATQIFSAIGSVAVLFIFVIGLVRADNTFGDAFMSALPWAIGLAICIVIHIFSNKYVEEQTAIMQAEKNKIKFKYDE